MGKFDKVKILESHVIYKGRGSIVADLLEFADGSKHEWVYFKGREGPGAVAVAAFTKENKMILTKQYRHPFGKLMEDLPAGGMTEGETPEQAALRELEEETGYTAEKLEWIGRFTWAPGAMGPGTVEIFFTKNLKPKGNFDPNEIADIEPLDFKTVLEEVLKGRYIDSALVIATLLIAVKGLIQA
jgi:ADP-ribose pyrophosphatase